MVNGYCLLVIVYWLLVIVYWLLDPLLYFYDDLFEMAIGSELESSALFSLSFVCGQGQVGVKQRHLISAGNIVVHEELAEIVGTVFVALLIETEVVDRFIVAVKGIEVERRGDGVQLLGK